MDGGERQTNVSSRDLLSFIAPAPSGENGRNRHSTFAVAHLLESRLVPQGILAGLNDEGKTSGDRLGGLCCLGLLGGGHLVLIFGGSGGLVSCLEDVGCSQLFETRDGG